MSFESNIKTWVHLDNNIKKLNDEISELKERRSSLKQDIMTEVNDKKLNDAVIKINNCRLKFVNVTQTQPLTFKFIEECLNDCIGAKTDVDNIIQYIKSKRQNKITKEIKRFNN